MAKIYVGSRLRQLRRERDLSQASLAEILDLSASYVNQIEHDVRPLTVPVLLKITEVFGVDATFFSHEDNSRLIAEIQDFMLDRELNPQSVELQELSEIVSNYPDLAQSMVNIHRKYRNIKEKLSIAVDSRRTLPDEPHELAEAIAMPHEEVRDFFYARQNYLDALDTEAETIAAQLGWRAYSIHAIEQALVDILRSEYDVGVVYFSEEADYLHRYDSNSRVLRIHASLSAGQKAFRMAAELGYLKAGPLINAEVDTVAWSSREAQTLALRGVASYFAAALILPYQIFHNEAEKSGYDIEFLSQLFGVGYETIAHRLSTLQRPNLRGIPFTFVRVDRAGNMSKRQSATGFHFTHHGGTCPLWNVFETFSTPGQILRQLAQMPDGRSYLWVSRTVHHAEFRFGQTGKTFAIGLGCEARHADRTVYGTGLNVDDLSAAVPIGSGCRVCTRVNCAQRAFPSVHKKIHIDAHESTIAPY